MVAQLDPQAQAGLQRMRDDPAGFMHEWLGADLWEKQIEIVESVRDYRRVAVKSCHSAGKSFIAARIVIWYLYAYQPSIVITTAPTANQVENILWRELRTAFAGAKRALIGRCLTTRIEIAPDWYALGFKASDTEPDRFQGFHAERILIVIDEAAGVHENVFGALNAIMTGEYARMLLIGNPTSVSGRFFDAFHRNREMWKTITIAAKDTPNLKADGVVRPYLITQSWIDEAIEEYGADSPYVQSRVHAEFPDISENKLIPLNWIERAHHTRLIREELQDDWGVEVGLDIARMGGDETALCVRRGPQVLAEHSWSKTETMETVGRVRQILEQYEPISKIKVDVIGIGAGVADRLRELKYPVVDVNVGAASSKPDDFQNLRCELWWNLRQRFHDGEIAGPINERTQAQLSDIGYKYVSRYKKPVIESKDEAKSRGVRSPDRAEALLLAFTDPPQKKPGRLVTF